MSRQTKGFAVESVDFKFATFIACAVPVNLFGKFNIKQRSDGVEANVGVL